MSEVALILNDNPITSDYSFDFSAWSQTKDIMIVPRETMLHIIRAESTAHNVFFHRVFNISNNQKLLEKRVIKLDISVQTKNREEINKIVKDHNTTHLIFFLASIILIAVSWLPGILNFEFVQILKQFSIAFSLMIVISYFVWRIK